MGVLIVVANKNKKYFVKTIVENSQTIKCILEAESVRFNGVRHLQSWRECL